MEPTLLDTFYSIVSVLALPLAFIQIVFNGIANFIVFDLLQLGPYLPITF